MSIASERPLHRLVEQWHPLGPVGVITAFNFPVAVWAWNAMLALVCGDTVIWKPSEKTPLTAIACQASSAARAAEMPDGAEGLYAADRWPRPDAGRAIAATAGLPLVSATGSVAMGGRGPDGRRADWAARSWNWPGTTRLIVAPSADLELAIRAIVFAAFGTAGQRCTTLRRLIVHESVVERLVQRLLRAV